MKVVIEVAPIRRHPLESPAHAILKRFNLRQRRQRDRDECYVVVREVNVRAIDMVNKKRAAFATLLPIPDRRTEHEMVDDQLTPSVKQVSKCFLAVRGIEDVVLLNLNPRQFAPLGAHLVTQTGERLLPFKMRLAGNKPFVLGHNCRLFTFDVVH